MKGRNVMIRASAGSGKTYELTNRYVALLAAGAAPERIVALTFTRKAAGEFFDEILNKLARAARRPDEAAKLAAEIARPELGRPDFLRLLRSVIQAMPRLRLGTIDAFFAGIVRAFPLELGLAGEFGLIEEHVARVERRQVLRRLYADSRGAGDEAWREFLEEFKRATFGAEEKRLEPRLDRFIDDHQELFLEAPEAELWGDPARIWPGGCPWREGAAALEPAIEALRDWLEQAAPEARQRRRWEDFLAAGRSWTPGAPLPGELVYVLKKALEAGPDLEAGRAVLEFDRRRQALSAAAGAALAALVRIVGRGVLARRLASTRGIFDFLRRYEAVYDRVVRRMGKLTFADVQRLLLPVALTGSDGADAAEGRLYLDFRLDGGIDHWLLDEFQDTSFGQWSILKNLIDEAIQDPGRSFFCVGDVKQAIFAWREGDPRLFGEIFRYYNAAAPATIAERHLDLSRRSGPAVVEMVNAVFGRAAALEAVFPREVAAAWAAEWRRHDSAIPNRKGQAALLHAGDAEVRWSLAVRLIREIRPLERGLTCAVLVQTNTAALALADRLRQEGGLPAVAESDLHVCVDNPLGTALLALFQAAVHPGDRLARRHVDMTPLGRILAAEGLDEPSRLSLRLLGQIHAEGFESTAETWLRRLDPELGRDDRFTRERARQFAAAAGLFDRTGRRDVTEFIQFMKGHAVRDAEAAGTIRVMTIHKSKGLGFDIVILPDLDGSTLLRPREGLAVRKSAGRAVEWILDLPPEPFRSHDPVLSAHVREAKADACYEKLSLLYVAMTRAKRALYLVAEPAGSSHSANFPRLLAAALGESPRPVPVGSLTLEGAWSAGDPEWHLGLKAEPPARPGPAEMTPLDAERTARVPRRAARRPSEAGAGAVAAARLFAPRAAADFGAAVHALLAEVEWGGDGFEAAWRSRPVDSAAREAALAFLRAPALAAVWSRPEGAAEAWRERPFEAVIEGAWVTGKIDRAVIVRDGGGRALSAVVYDFKTETAEGESSPAEARHAAQMEFYRQAVAKLAGLPPAAVGAALALLRPEPRLVFLR